MKVHELIDILTPLDKNAEVSLIVYYEEFSASPLTVVLSSKNKVTLSDE